MKRILRIVLIICAVGIGAVGVQQVYAALVVPSEIQQPGTQPSEVRNLESPDKCDNCHGGYDQAVEPAFNWRGSMMANAGRDPMFWATLAIAEQDFDGSGDLCLRCHSTGGWYAGRSTPTDGSALAAGDADGVECDACHKMTNTDNSEYQGVMNWPFIANDEESPATGYYGSGMESLYDENAKLGPYSDAAAKHQFMESDFHRDVNYCGTCHDVSNPAVGDLAHNNGAQATADAVTDSGVLGSPVDEKAAFNNFPFQYGIVERTFSEFFSSLFDTTLVSSYDSLPDDLKAGAVQAAYDSAEGDYVDGDARYFSCQTCHMSAVTGYGANKAGIPLRTDLPLHDMTGGNYWVPDVMKYQNTQGTLRLGGGLTDTQLSALDAGILRAQQQLDLAASLTVTDNILRITNLTGHKLISGYPEGRRMWLNIKWYDAGNALLREDGRYDVVAYVSDKPVKSIVDLADPNTKIYEAHYAMTQEWANQLLGIGYGSDLPLSFDRVTGNVSYTLGQLAAQDPGTYHETFHFVLNNIVAKDNRIPPYGMSYEEARTHNALPVPADQYGNPGAGGTYNYWDEITLAPPSGAASAQIRLLYQPTSWEYVQFLYEANTGANSFLADEGVNLLDAWLNTGMAEPYTMASAIWGSTPPYEPASPSPANHATNASVDTDLSWIGGDPDAGDTVTYDVYLGTNSTPPLKATIGPYPSTQSSITYDPGTLVDGAKYYWQIIARDNHGTTREGPVWEFSVGIEMQLFLQAGWNMVSVPVAPADDSMDAVFPGVVGVFTWNGTSKSYYEPTVINPQKGYWVAVTENTTIAISGIPMETWTTDIKAGWNVIGSVNTGVSIIDPNDDPDGSVILPAYRWDPVSKSYITTTDIEPGKGYWIASTNDCTLAL